MKQANGRGTVIYEEKRNKYRAYFTTPAGIRITKRFNTKPEASAWLTLQQANVLNNNFVEPSKITLGAWLVTWLKDYKKATVAIRTFEKYSELAEKCAPIADTDLQKLTAPQIQRLYNELLVSLSASSVNKVHKILHAALKKAVMVGLITRSPIDAVEAPTCVKKKISTFTQEEIKKLYSVTENRVNGRYYPLIVLAINTGARLGELLALRWSDIDFTTGEISISRSLKQTRYQGIIIGEPKTDAGNRIISVPASVLDVLKNYRKQSDIVSLSGLIFLSRNGTPWQPRNVEHRWKSIVKAADIPYRNFHVIRHTHATDLLANNIPIVEVARRLGHSRVSHTLDMYGHAIPRYDKKIAEKVAELYSVK